MNKYYSFLSIVLLSYLCSSTQLIAMQQEQKKSPHKTISFFNVSEEVLYIYFKGVLPVINKTLSNNQVLSEIKENLGSDAEQVLCDNNNTQSKMPKISALLQENFFSNARIILPQKLYQIKLKPTKTASTIEDLQYATHFLAQTQSKALESGEIEIADKPSNYQLKITEEKIAIDQNEN